MQKIIFCELKVIFDWLIVNCDNMINYYKDKYDTLLFNDLQDINN